MYVQFWNMLLRYGTIAVVYWKGSRLENIQNPCICHNCSALQSDQYRIGVATNLYCPNGNAIKDAKYFFFECLNSDEQQTILLNEIFIYPNVNLNTFLWVT